MWPTVHHYKTDMSLCVILLGLKQFKQLYKNITWEHELLPRLDDSFNMKQSQNASTLTFQADNKKMMSIQ